MDMARASWDALLGSQSKKSVGAIADRAILTCEKRLKNFVIGAVIGIVVFLVVRNQRQSPSPEVRPDEKAEGG